MRKLLLTISLFSLGCQGAKELDPQLKRKKLEQMVSKIGQTFNDVNHLSVAELRALAPNSIVLVDVRSERERSVSIIPGAITIEKYRDNIENYSGKTLIAYCTIGYRSSEFVQKMSKKHKRSYNLKGSILEWTFSGGKLVDNQGNETKRVHVYGKNWNIIADGYEAIY